MTIRYLLIQSGDVLAELESKKEADELGRMLMARHPERRYDIVAEEADW